MNGFSARLGLAPRDRHEAHRVSTPLELLFDLASVIAIAAAAAGLHHAVAESHATEGVARFAFAFFAIWWAWMNYTWFASAYDNRTPAFRLLTLLIIFGALVMAAGIPAIFEGQPFLLGLIGYLIMRLGMILLWLLAARGDLENRNSALRYALGIALAQFYWIGLILLIQPTSSWFPILFLVGAAIELAVPLFAERSRQTAWHRHHIVERYGLLNIIVLGECMLAVVLALRATHGELSIASPLVHTAVSGAVTTFCLWWLYFTDDEHLARDTDDRAFVWGYGHIIVFAAGAATGAGFSVLVDIIEGHSNASLRTGDLAVGIPVALYLFGLWFVRDRFCLSGYSKWLLPAGASSILAVAALSPGALELMTFILVLTTFARSRAAPSSQAPRLHSQSH